LVMRSNSKQRLLVVDDTETNIDILVDMLGDEFRVSVAMDGESALEDAERIQPDLVLLDIMMPGIDGYQVCKKLKENEITKDIPIIFLTALSEGDNQARGLALGAVDYITKPFRPELVKARIADYLGHKLQQGSLATAPMGGNEV
jgi:putative two-component system response regulator